MNKIYKTPEWQAQIKALNQQLDALVGFTPFSESYIWDRLCDPQHFSIEFNKIKGQGYLYGRDLAVMRQQLFNCLPQSERLTLFNQKCEAMDLEIDRGQKHRLVNVTDIGMGHSVYCCEWSNQKKLVIKESENQHATFYYDWLKQCGCPTLEVRQIDNTHGRWILSEYIAGGVLTEANIKKETRQSLLIQSAQQAAIGDILGRGDRHFENYIWYNEQLYPIDIAHLFYPNNNQWLDRYISGGQSEYCMIITQKQRETESKAIFWDAYQTMFEQCKQKEHQLNSCINRYYNDKSKIQYVTETLEQPEAYIKQQKTLYNAAYDIFRWRYKKKKQLEAQVKKTPELLEKSPLLHMYYHANKQRLTAFFLINRFGRDDILNEIGE